VDSRLISLFSQYIACPEGFEIFNGQSCIKMVTDALSHADALKECTDLHPRATLLETRNAAKQSSLTKLYQKYVDDLQTGIHIGLIKDDDGAWTWETDGVNVFQTSNNKCYFEVHEVKFMIHF
jgi:uncharacterized protein YneR